MFKIYNNIAHGERFNTLTHLVGTLLAITGLVFLLIPAQQHGDTDKLLSFSVYGASLIALYLCSTLYHATNGKVKDVFQKLDHAAIYLLIAGSYTPFALVTLRQEWGWTFFFTVWGLALFGIAQELTLGKKTRLLSLILYIAMGWLAVFDLKPLIAALPGEGLMWLIAGGLLYSAGVYWYVNDDKIRHGHGIWHAFVLGGSVSQYLCIAYFVA